MQSWTTEMWQAALIGLVVGFVIGYFLLRLTKESAKKQVKTEAELRAAKEQLENQKQQLEKHFFGKCRFVEIPCAGLSKTVSTPCTIL